MTWVVHLPGLSAREARKLLARALEEKGLQEADLDARVLVRHATGIDPALPGLAAEKTLEAPQIERLREAAHRRLSREPVARILGRREFHGLDFALNPACLVPRPDTETIVDAALVLLPASAPVRILDLGTGPGTILLALLAERPLAEGLGIDRSAEALEAARTNAEALGLGARVRFAQGDWTEGLDGPFDLVVSNPPYIPSATCLALDPEVRDHDPRLALDGGLDGLDAYRLILGGIGRVLTPAGRVVLELGIGQAAPVAAIALSHGFVVAGLHSDLAGIPRALVLQRAT
jgi:release factor glutamine methyltransferase